MRRITEHVFAEIYFWGCSPGVHTTSDGVFIIDTPQQPINAVQPSGLSAGSMHSYVFRTS